MRLSVKLMSLFLLIGIVPLVVVSVLINIQSGKALQHETFARMEMSRQIRKVQVENYFKERMHDISVLAESVEVIDVLTLARRLAHEFEVSGQKLGDKTWQALIQSHLVVWLEKYKKTYGYHDLLLLDEDGHVVFTVMREPDLGENVLQGSLQESGLARMYAKANRGIALEDFSPYAPSKDVQAAFMGAPVKRDGVLLGVIALQLASEEMDALMAERAGMGETEDTYLVGKVGELSSYRNNRTVKEGRIGHSKSDPFIKRALAGESGSSVKIGSTGQPELVSFAPIQNIPGLKWAIISTISTKEAFFAMDALNRSIWLMGVICAVVVMLIGWFFSRSITRPLQQVIGVISSSSSQMAASLTEQERIATQQAASVNETNTTMEELGVSARQSAEQAEVAAGGVNKAQELSQFGMSRVDETLVNMEKTKTKVEAIAQQILLLSEKTSQIRDITSLVSDFANETKMLAMNAAVEAVRAGEHGKGFSVLAVETRKLADESKRSAGRINTLVEEIQKATNSTVMATEEGSKTVDEGMDISRNTAETFREVEETMGHASQGTQQISLNVRQQSVAIRQVVEAMKSVNSGARESASGMSQVKEGIRTLNEAAQMLRSTV